MSERDKQLSTYLKKLQASHTFDHHSHIMRNGEEISEIFIGKLLYRNDMLSLQSMQFLPVRREEIFLEVFA